jgi:hypothetical protein
MGTITNLYVIPRRQDPNGLRGAQVAETLVSEHLVAPPYVIGPALTAEIQLVQPQDAFPGEFFIQMVREGKVVGDEFLQRSRRYFEFSEASLIFDRESEPQILAFSRLDERTPAIREDFKHYKGPECSVGLYIAPKGIRLLLTGEKITWVRDDEPVIEHYVAFDAIICEWLHFQGKAAPWLDVYCGSCLDRAIRSVWSDIEVVENDWL